MMSRHKLIVFEGLDGTGKSTLAALLAGRLRAVGAPVHLVDPIQEPFESLRRAIYNKNNPDTSYYFYLCALLNYAKPLRHLLSTSVVIVDRYIHTTHAYHLARGASCIVLPSDLNLPVADVTFVITTQNHKVRLDRISSRGKDVESQEQTSRADQISKYYSTIGAIQIDNSSGDVSLALQQILLHVQPLLPDHPLSEFTLPASGDLKDAP